MKQSSGQVFVSVIIPVYNSNRSLRECLKALAKQTYPSTSYEVIVVDNASDEDVESVVSDFSFVRLEKEEKVGSYAARNRGIKNAAGEVLAFTDADCIPDERWLEEGVNSLLETEKVGLVAGRIEFTFRDQNHPSAVEFCDSTLFLNQRLYVEKNHFAATANLFTLKTVTESVGTFNLELKSGGDAEWGLRVFEAGYRQIYTPEAVVRHPTRSSWRLLCKKVMRVSGGLADVNGDKEKSWLQFSKEMFSILKPPKSWLLWKMSDPRLSMIVKYQFLLLYLCVNWLQVWERTRIKLGETSAR